MAQTPYPNPPARRSRLTRFAIIAFVLLLSPIFVLATTIAATGVVTVEVHDKTEGLDLYIPVPAILLDLALFVAPLAAPEEALAEAREHIAPYRDALEAIAEELENCPNGVLVDVRDGDEHIQVRKTWRSFEVDVDTDDTDVFVKVPARIVSSALDVL